MKNGGKHANVTQTGLWVNPMFPELSCSPDGLVCISNDVDSCEGLVEVKCPFTLKGADIHQFEQILSKKQRGPFCLHFRDKILQLKRSHAYYYQIQTQLGVMNRKWCDLIVWSAKSAFVERIYADKTLFDEIKETLIQFHHNYLCTELFEMRIPRNLKPLNVE